MSEGAPAFGLRLSGLADRFGLSEHQSSQLRAFASILVADDRAPTTVREPKRVRDDHLADALVALQLPAVRAAGTIADLGAGAGVPGIPLAIALPEARVTLVEGNGHKCEFMMRAAEAAMVSNVEVVNERAEAYARGLGSFDVVTARALASLDVVAEYGAPLLRVGGSLVVWRGVRDPGAEADAARAADLLGLLVEAPLRVEPYAGAENRHLHVMLKVMDTPTRFPRRPGVARKRPLGRA